MIRSSVPPRPADLLRAMIITATIHFYEYVSLNAAVIHVKEHLSRRDSMSCIEFT